MAISFINAATAQNAAANTLTPSEPTNTAENDLIIAVAGIQAVGGTWTDPADFNELDQEEYGAAGNVGSAYVGWKIRGADAGSGYAFSSSSTAEQMSVALITLRGIDTATPFDVTFVAASHQNENLNSLTAAAPAITTVTDGAWVVVIQRWTGAIAGITQGAPDGYTSRSEILLASRSQIIATKEVSPAGTETPGVWTTSGAAGDEDSINWTLAIRPAGAGAVAKKRRQGLMGVG